MKVSQLALHAELGETAFRLEGGARKVVITPDGKRVISIGSGVHVWDLDSGECVAEIATALDRQYALALSTDGTRIFVGGEKVVQVIALGAKPKVIAKPGVKKGIVKAAAFAPDKGFVFGDGRTPRRFDAKGKEQAPLTATNSDIDAIAVSPDGTRVVTCGGKITKLHALDGKKPTVIGTWEDLAKYCGFSPDGKYVWTSSFAATKIRSVATGETTWESGDIVDVGAVSVDRLHYACLLDDKVAIFAPPKKTPIVTIPFDARSCAFTPDGKRIVVAGEALGIAVYEVEDGRRLLPSATGTSGAIDALAVAEKLPHAVFSAGPDGSVMLWDIDAGAVLERVGTVEGGVTSLAAAADGRTVFTTSRTGKPLAWNVGTATSTTLESEGHGHQSIAISPNAKRVATLVYMPRSLEVFELASKKRIANVKHGRAYDAATIAFLTDDIVVGMLTTGNVSAVHAKGGKEVYNLHTEYAKTFCIIGDTLVVGYDSYQSGRIELHDATSGEHRSRLREAGGAVFELRALDDDLVAVLQRGEQRDTSAVEIWSLTKSRAIARATIDGEARALAVRPDGKRIYVGTQAGGLLVYQR